MDDYGKMAEDNPGKLIRKIIFWGVITFMVLCAVGWGISIMSQPARVISKTLDADNMINNYEWYKTQYNDFKAINQKIKDAEGAVVKFKSDMGPRKDWDYEDKTEASRLSSIVDGLKYQKADIVSAYNARSKMANRTLFKSNDLPEMLTEYTN